MSVRQKLYNKQGQELQTVDERWSSNTSKREGAWEKKEKGESKLWREQGKRNNVRASYRKKWKK